MIFWHSVPSASVLFAVNLQILRIRTLVKLYIWAGIFLLGFCLHSHKVMRYVGCLDHELFVNFWLTLLDALVGHTTPHHTTPRHTWMGLYNQMLNVSQFIFLFSIIPHNTFISVAPTNRIQLSATLVLIVHVESLIVQHVQLDIHVQTPVYYLQYLVRLVNIKIKQANLHVLHARLENIALQL